jgi:2'-5' RNA ligase
MDARRLFIAFETPPPVKAQIQDVVSALREVRGDVHWEAPEKLHCTLKFLGPTRPELLAPVSSVLEDIGRGAAPFTLRYQNVGFFPGPSSARIVWIGIEVTDDRLRDLHRMIEDRMAPLGFERELRGFHPHVTLGRIKSGRNLRRLTGTAETLTFSSALYTIDSLILLRSDLRPSGSVYTQEKSFPLIGNPEKRTYTE